ncbi:MAG TPA: hypothetical protein VLO11_09480, partial [Luteolibacter sp.]|nr:hypothetical protein [Luteolibacter sp.]
VPSGFLPVTRHEVVPERLVKVVMLKRLTILGLATPKLGQPLGQPQRFSLVMILQVTENQ